MSGAGPMPEREALAGEYVLGTLDAREAARVEKALPGDPALAEAVARWQRDLAPLLELARPDAPPADLWQRIAGTLDAEAPAAPSTPSPAPARRAGSWWASFRQGSFWRGWAIGATAVAASLAAILVVRQAEPETRLATVLLTTTNQSAWLVEASRGALHLSALNPRGVEADRVLQLWALPQGATVPTSLGLVPPEGRFSVTPAQISPAPGMLIEITLEPPGGSPTGRPTGPVQFIGRLAPARSG